MQETAKVTYKTKIHKNAEAIEYTTTFVLDVDDESLVDNFIVPHAKVMAQSKFRNGNIADLNGEIKLSDLLVKAPRGVFTTAKAVNVITEKPMHERVQAIFEMAGETGCQGYLDNALANGKISEEEHVEGCDVLTELVNLQ